MTDMVEVSGRQASNIGRMIALARRGDASAIEGLPAALAEAAGRGGGDVEDACQANALNILPTAKIPECREAAEARLELMRRELAPPGSSVEVRMMASRVVADWLSVQCWEQPTAGFVGAAGPSTCGSGLRFLDFLNRRLDGSVKRYTQSLTALAKIKRMAPPVRIETLNVAVVGRGAN